MESKHKRAHPKPAAEGEPARHRARVPALLGSGGVTRAALPPPPPSIRGGKFRAIVARATQRREGARSTLMRTGFYIPRGALGRMRVPPEFGRITENGDAELVVISPEAAPPMPDIGDGAGAGADAVHYMTIRAGEILRITKASFVDKQDHAFSVGDYVELSIVAKRYHTRDDPDNWRTTFDLVWFEKIDLDAAEYAPDPLATLTDVIIPRAIALSRDEADVERAYAIAGRIRAFTFAVSGRELPVADRASLFAEAITTPGAGGFIEQIVYPSSAERDVSSLIQIDQHKNARISINIPMSVYTWTAPDDYHRHLFLVAFRMFRADFTYFHHQLGFDHAADADANGATYQLARFLAAYLPALSPVVYVGADKNDAGQDNAAYTARLLDEKEDAFESCTPLNVQFIGLPHFLAFLEKQAIALDPGATKPWERKPAVPARVHAAPGGVYNVTHTGTALLTGVRRLFFLPDAPLDDAQLEKLRGSLRKTENVQRHCAELFNAHESIIAGSVVVPLGPKNGIVYACTDE